MLFPFNTRLVIDCGVYCDAAPEFFCCPIISTFVTGVNLPVYPVVGISLFLVWLLCLCCCEVSSPFSAGWAVF